MANEAEPIGGGRGKFEALPGRRCYRAIVYGRIDPLTGRQRRLREV